MLVTFIVFSLISGSESYTIDQQTQLHKDVLNGYDRRIRPGIDRSEPLQIDASFYLTTLNTFSESEGRIAIVGAFHLTWIDHRLSWDPTSYGNDLGKTTLFVKDIWTPQLVNWNPYNLLNFIGLNELSCEIYYSGQVYFLPPDLYQATCDADVTNYPFDKQICSLKYYIPGYYIYDINITATSSAFNLDLYTEHGLWDLRETFIQVETASTNFQVISLTLHMKRRTTYYIAGLLLPIVLMNFIQVLVFLLPVESGERLGYCITVLLAVTVFLTIIQDKLPEASEPNVSLLTYKLLADMVIGCGMILAVVIGMRFYHKTDDKEIPGCLQGFANCFYLCCTQKNSNKIDEFAPEKVDLEPRAMTATWYDVGKAFDRVCLTVFFLSLVLNNSI
ncbi:acetylcholine receptor subunit alpha-type acr-16-like, partial [Ostrea edulis]|uniref:acetylcholine receptor subunit alpha-type acr-16-like n=1 Tax=Ostrea edulis TaxID=37623 RepID=UPI0024AFC7F1